MIRSHFNLPRGNIGLGGADGWVLCVLD